MPQFLNTQSNGMIDRLVDQVLEESLPGLSANGWSEHLQANGLTPSTLAQMYVESLHNCKPAQRVKEIRELLGSLGIVRQSSSSSPAQPTVVINGENIQLNQMLLPIRDS